MDHTETTPATASPAKIKGLFSTQTEEKVGTGTTTRRTISKTYWYAVQGEGTVVQVRPLNKHNLPSGHVIEVELEDFLRKYQPEPEYYQQWVAPRMHQLDDTISRAESHRAKGAHYSAELEYGEALALDEENAKATFGLGLTYMARGEANKARDVFDRLVHIEAAFEEENKHLFNEFGINLRKSGMNEQAVEYYLKALEMTEGDENLHCNIARAYFENGQADKAREHLHTALEMNPEHEEARQFLEYLDKSLNKLPLDSYNVD